MEAPTPVIRVLALLLATLLVNVVLSQDDLSCVPPRSSPSATNRLRHRMFTLETPFRISYGGYVTRFPDCNIRGVKEAVEDGFPAIGVAAAFLNSREIAMTPDTSLKYYMNTRGLRTFEMNGDAYSRLSYNQTISYGPITYTYSEVYRSSFLYEVFETLPHYNGVIFINVAPMLSGSVLVDEKILVELTVSTLKYVIDSYNAWSKVAIYETDVVKALALAKLTSCSHLFGTAYYLQNHNSTSSVLYRFAHEGVPELRRCTQIVSDFRQYSDFMIQSGSAERISCASFTMVDLDMVMNYDDPSRLSTVNITETIKSNYYTDGVTNYYVGLYASPESFRYVSRNDNSGLHTILKKFVEKYDFDFYMTPLNYFYD